MNDRHPEGRSSPKAKILNRHGAKNAMMSKTQKPITVLTATAAQSALGHSNLKSARDSPGSPGGVLAVKRFLRIGANLILFARHSLL